MTAVRKIEVTRAAWGTALLLAPRWTLSSVHRIEVDTRSVLVARVLGGRQIAQAVLSGREPSAEVLAVGVWVDLAHATSALALAGVDPRRAWAGLVDAAAATTWVIAGIHDLRMARVADKSAAPRRVAAARWLLTRLPGGGRLRELPRGPDGRRGVAGAMGWGIGAKGHRITRNGLPGDDASPV